MEPFDWRDGERVVYFGRGRADDAVALAGGPGYTLLTTERAQRPALADGAGAVHLVGAGRVDELADGLLDVVTGDRVVALGGGRVIDTAKAIAAARGGMRVCAVPTTLSGAEMTWVHRQATRAVDPVRARPDVVVCDPAVAASQPLPALAASALNALGHAAEAPCTTLANPVATLMAERAAQLIAGLGDQPDRDALALAGLLAGAAIDSAWYGLHHVLSQTLVRVGAVGHGPVNAILLQHTLGALAARQPERAASLAAAMGGDPTAIARRICALTGTVRLRDLGVTEAQLDECADAAAGRGELRLTPPAADRDELRALYAAAF